MKNKKYLFLLFIIIPTIIFFIARSFSIEYTQEIKSVEIESDEDNSPGKWHIDKSAEWVESDKALVTFEVNTFLKTSEAKYKDVILVIDVSGSMNGEKIDRAKQDAIELTNYLLSDNHNRMALISFDSSSTIVSNFINNKDMMVGYINNLSTQGCTDYNSALLNVNEIMDSYIKNENKDLMVLFLTDGYPNEDIPNEKATYSILKDKYPYMTINGIQYEMGIDIIEEIINISDNQWVADSNTLHNVLFDATLSPLTYDNFVITDFINDDYFYVSDVSDINVNRGEAMLIEENGVQKVTWNLFDTYKTGDSVKMTIELKLKDGFKSIKGYYPTNKSETIVSKLQNESEVTVNSTLTPVLKNTYFVMYDTNSPDGCNMPNYDTEEYFVFTNVMKKQDVLSCPGYLFRGWQIDSEDNEDIIKINDELFIMPSHDVHIRAVWTKQDLVKASDGSVYVNMTLYKVIEREAAGNIYAKRYTGTHQDSMDNSGTSDIYYYYADSNDSAATIIKEKNNVIFANHCWQMYRTTDTGGVKLLYNGEPEDGKCMNRVGNQSGRGNHIGYSRRSYQSMSGTYYYADDYTYENGNFKLSGTINSQRVTSDNASSTIPTLVGKYTCRKTTSSATCKSLYLIDGYYNSTYAYVIDLISSSDYSQLGTLQYNTKSSLTGVGYMHNAIYNPVIKTLYYSETMLSYSSLNESYWYADSVSWGTTVSNNYNLDNPYQVNSTDYSNLVGKYTFRSSDQDYTSTTVNYITAIDGTNMYYIQLTDMGNHTLADFNHTYTYGDSYIDNLDGTYTVINEDGTSPLSTNNVDWFTDYSNINSKYVCKNAINDVCSDLWYTNSVSGGTKTKLSFIKVSNEYKYAKEFEYKEDPIDGVYKYFLKDDNAATFWNLYVSRRTILSNAHYTCFNKSGVCEEVAYIYYMPGTVADYITLTDGKDITTAVQEMLSLDNNSYHVNSTNSTIKTAIDAWYKKYILNDFDQYIEDTIYCNYRSQSNGDTNGWNPDGGDVLTSISFHHGTTDLFCPNDTDKFSTLNNKARLKYKVGLVTAQEIYLLNNRYLSKTGQQYWTMTPYMYGSTSGTVVFVVHKNGGATTDGSVSNTYGVRPVISLVPGIEYVDGDGSMEHPYLIDDGTH